MKEGDLIYMDYSNVRYAYKVTGMKVMNIRVDGSDKSYHLNLPQGCYIVKVGNVVRKIALR